ncbi:MAG: hypothetical protein M1504_02990 [Candidatus Marsarchaeota archaeon]|nr:hypothetical protein [Candidatus Marsarchaeota archaeon]
MSEFTQNVGRRMTMRREEAYRTMGKFAALVETLRVEAMGKFAALVETLRVEAKDPNCATIRGGIRARISLGLARVLEMEYKSRKIHELERLERTEISELERFGL